MVNSVPITTFTGRVRDPKKHTPAYKIFHYTYSCEVPQMYLYTEQYMRISGQVVTGDQAYDEAAPSRMTGVTLTIGQMATLMDEGAQIRLLDPLDAKVIYEIIYQHLSNWAGALKTHDAFGVTNAPVDDLRRLSLLADTLYSHAMRFFTKQIQVSSLVSRFESMMGARKMKTRTRVDPAKEKERLKEERESMPSHTNFTDDIIKRSGSRRNQWS